MRVQGPHSPLCTAMTGLWCCVKLESRGESWGDGLLNGDLSISVFFTGDEMPVGGGGFRREHSEIVHNHEHRP